MTAQYVPEFIIDTALNVERTYMYSHLDGRSILEALFSVRYLMIGDKSGRTVPYGFHDTGKSETVNGTEIKLYEADNPLSIGYTYDSYTSTEDFLKMNPAQRQETMLKSVVLDDSSFPKSADTLTVHSVLKNIEENSNIKITDDKIYVLKDGASAKLNIDKVRKSELYFLIRGLDFESNNKRSQYSDTEWNALEPIERAKILSSDFLTEKKSSTNIGVSYGDLYQTISYMNHRNIYYCGQDDYLCNLGYIETADDEFRIHFKTAGVYDYTSIDVLAQDTDTINQSVKKLSEEMLTDVKMGENSVSGKISLSDNKILVLSVPYSTGWTAYVDGQKAELKEANLVFMAIELKAGEHNIEIKYETPYLRAGAVLTIAGLISFFITFIYFRIKRAV